MPLKNSIEIHETAFVTSAYRAQYQDISKDIYAKLWRNSKTKDWIENYSKIVSMEEALTHSLRNRFFLERIKDAIQTHNIEVLINFGSGFSMYPYLLSEELVHIEIDKPEIIEFKKKRVEVFIDDYKLPKREVHYLETDFSTHYENALATQINAIQNDRSSFILLEGVLFFLNRTETNRLFDFFSKIQSKNGLIGSVSFQDKMENEMVFKKLLAFFKEQITSQEPFEYQTLNDEFYKELPNYKLIEQHDYYSLRAKFAPEKELVDDILNENLYILEKQ